MSELERRKSPPQHWSNWYLTALKLAVALLLALLVSLFWILRQNEADEQRSTLIADVLWLEQSIGFHLEGNGERLQQLANDLGTGRDGSAQFRLRAQYLLKNNPDLEQLLWIDAAGRLIDSMSAKAVSHLGASGVGGTAMARSIELASKLGKPVYSDAYRKGETYQFDVVFPVFERGRFRGVLVSVYSFSGLVKQLVPWWFAEKYQVRILDAKGNTLASNSKVSDAETALSYSIPFEPPGYGMALQVSVYRGSGNLAPKLLTALIVALAAAVLWSLWVMRGHIQRRLAAEQALRSEYAYRKAMEDSLTVGMRARDRQGRVTYVNPAFCRMVGFSEEELLNARPPMPYWPPEELERAQAIHEAAIAGRAPREGFELPFMRKDGSRFDALILEAPLIDADGQHTGWMASIVDVTARKRAEELARQQQEKLQSTSRLVTMGEMASTLAHELNQPLAAIASYNAGCLNMLDSGAVDVPEMQGALTKLGVQAQRAGRIIRRVHDFVRKSEPRLALCDPGEVIDDSIGFVEGAAKLKSVRIARQIAEECPKIMGDRVMLEQALLNLMRNAIEAMSSSAPEDRCLTIVLQAVDDQLQIRIIDRGTGIALADREKLFTPFFSTKSDGMGMGLNICRTIVEFHHGRLWFEDNPAGGTVAVISLPITMP